jgi:hypothetical protein
MSDPEPLPVPDPMVPEPVDPERDPLWAPASTGMATSASAMPAIIRCRFMTLSSVAHAISRAFPPSSIRRASRRLARHRRHEAAREQMVLVATTALQPSRVPAVRAAQAYRRQSHAMSVMQRGKPSASLTDAALAWRLDHIVEEGGHMTGASFTRGSGVVACVVLAGALAAACGDHGDTRTTSTGTTMPRTTGTTMPGAMPTPRPGTP